MRKLATFAFSFAAALILAVYFLPTEYVLYIAVGLALISCTGLMLKNDLGKRLFIIAIAAALGLTWFSAYNRLFRQSAEDSCGGSMRISAEITNYSDVYDYGTRVDANIILDGRKYKSLLYFYSNQVELLPGDIISVDAELKMADTMYGEATVYYAANGYVLRATASETPNVYRPEKVSFKYFPAKVSKAVENLLDELYSEFDSSFMKALLLGNSQLVPEEFTAQMKTTGLTHVFVVSGLHVGFLISIISLLARRRRLTAPIAIPVIVFFSAMSGFTPSVCRASIMYILVIVAPLFYRDSDGLTNVSIAMLVLLALNPFTIANVAFQLSFACCVGICLFAPPVYRWISSTRPIKWLSGLKVSSTKPGRYVLNFITSSLSTSLGVWIPVTPITALSFGTVCIISPVSNLLTLWAFSLCFIAGTVALPFGFIWLKLGLVISLLPKLLIRYITAVVSLLYKVPFATISSTFFSFKIWLVFVYAVVVFSVVFKSKRPVIPIICCVLTFAAALLTGNMYINGTDLTFSALNVGQGQCLVASSRGNTVVIDCGGSLSPDDALTAYMRDLGTNKIDMLIVTHYHSDHAEYIPYVLSSFDVGTVVVPDVVDTTGLRYEILQAAENNECEIVVLGSDAFVDFGTSSISIFGPMGGTSANEQCLSMVISHDNYDILITADMDQSMENLLVATKDIPDIEVLMVGHHGSKLSTGETLLAAVDPETAVISVGANSYGHPTEETLYRLEAFGVTVMRTDELGNITFRK